MSDATRAGKDGPGVSWRIEQRDEKGAIVARSMPMLTKALARNVAADWRRREPTQRVYIVRVTIVSRRWRVGIVQCRVWRDERAPRWCPKWLWTADGLVSFAGSSSTYQNAIDTVASVVRGMQ